ncbi:hypothetical protein EC09BKT76207_3089, partial [Escherichia coli 09BKT076207]
QNILLKNEVCLHGRITRNPANWQNEVNKVKAVV